MQFLTDAEISQIEQYRIRFCEKYIDMFIRSFVEATRVWPHVQLLELINTKCSVTSRLIYLALSGSVYWEMTNPIVQPCRAYLVDFTHADHSCVIITGYDNYQVIESYICKYGIRSHTIPCIGFDRLTNAELGLPRFRPGCVWCEIPINSKSITENLNEAVIWINNKKSKCD